MRLSIRTALVVASLALFAGNARAQPTAGPPAPADAITPPRPLAPLTAAYPEGARGDAEVEVVITVAADGSVRSATVNAGIEPFAAAAIAASANWRFEPAMRGGKPIVAKIRAVIQFHAPAPIETPTAPEPSAPQSNGAAIPPPPKPIEVTVRGQVAPPGATSVSRAEVRLLPGAFGDPFRAVEAMPGVSPIASGLPFFYVRGAPPGNVGYFLDGIRVPLLYHIGLGPSVIHPALMDRVDLYPGGYPASYGRFAGGIVSGETRDPIPEFHGEANIRVVDAGALVEAPFDGGRGTVLVGGRYSYTGLLTSVLPVPVDLRYWDYQARVTYDLTSKDRITVFAFGAYDYLDKKSDQGPVLLFDTTFHRVDLRYDHRVDAGTTVRQAVTFGYDVTDLDRGRFARDRMLAARTDVVHRVNAWAVLRAGADMTLDKNDVDLDRGDGDVGFTSFFKPHLDLSVGARIDVVLAITRRLEVTPGLRVDLYGSQGLTAIGVDPRLSSRLAISDGLRVVSALGVASQPPSFILPGPGFSPGLDGGLQRSFQTSLGLEADLPADVTTTVTLFRDAFFNMNDALGSVATTGTDLDRSFNQRSLGSSEGLEVNLRRRLTRRLGAFVSYTLSRSDRLVDVPYVASIFPAQIGVRTALVPSAFDRTHVLSAAVAYDLGRGFNVGTRVVFYTGVPRTMAGPAPAYEPMTTGRERLPPFFRLDVRLEKRWHIGQRGWVAAVLEVQNATLSKETLNGECDGRICTTQELGPVTIPSIGLEGGL